MVRSICSGVKDCTMKMVEQMGELYVEDPSEGGTWVLMPGA